MDWALDWGAPGVVAAVVVAVLAVVLAAMTARRLPTKGRRIGLVALRTATVATILVALLQPVWVTTVPARSNRMLAVLVDRSASMGQHEHGASRLQRAVTIARRLAKAQSARLMTFDSRVRPLPATDGAVTAGGSTDIGIALGGLRDMAAAGRLGAVVVVSDGVDHAELAADVRDGVLGRERRHLLDELGVPVHGILVGDRELRDVAVTAITASPFAFVRSVLHVVVDVAVGGYAGSRLATELIVERSGVEVTRVRVPLDGPVQRHVAVQVQPLNIGVEVLTARMVPLSDEATISNNVRHHRLRVLRDRTRVLHVAGHPSWDTRFLRSHLHADPSVELVSFYIMVSQGAGYFVHAADTTLIEFPTQQLFEETIGDFDLIVFQDFQFARFEVERYLPQLDRYVRDGGAFLVVGGGQAFAAGGYERSRLTTMLPVAMSPPEAGRPLYSDTPTPVQLTDVGARHPVTRVRPDADANRAAFAELSLPGHNAGLSAKAGAGVLLKSPDGAPLLAVSAHDKGRVATVASDGLWTWAFAADGPHRGAMRDDYHALLERLRGWLTRDPDYDLLRVTITPEAPHLAAATEVHAKLVGAAGAPRAGVALQWRAFAAGEPAPRWTAAATTGADGAARWRWTPGRGGVMRIQVRDAGGEIQAATLCAVDEANDETRDLAADPRGLALLAEASGGTLTHGAAPPGPLPFGDRAGPPAVKRVRSELWSHPLVGVLLLVLLAVEWTLRRRWGLA